MKELIPVSKKHIAPWRALWGPAPVLSSEAPELFEAFLEQLAIGLRPQDPVEFMMIWHYAVETWRINRGIRHGTVAIERRHAEGVRDEMRRARLQNAQRQRHDMAHIRAQTPADIAALEALSEKVRSTSDDVNEICERKATELEHNKAFERSMVFQEQLDKMIASASRRRDEVLFQLEAYRAGLGAQARQGADQLLDGEAESVLPAAEVPALAPTDTDAGLKEIGGPKAGEDEKANEEISRWVDENANRIEDD